MYLKQTFLIALILSSISLTAKLKDVDTLVELSSIDPTFKIECMYATYHNFTGQQIYPARLYSRCYLRKEVAEQLHTVQKELAHQGLGLLIWDAFRPMEGQKKLWSVFPVPGYVADPAKGGRHTRGTTVDLTIIDLATGKPLDMGCGFDVFIDRAHSTATDLSETALKNRLLLKSIMEKHGFTQLKTEWWHFEYKNIENYPPLDVDFDELP